MNKSQSTTVYVIDDDTAVLKGLRLLIKSVGLEVVTFESAEEFLGSHDPSWRGCLVLDVRMRGMSGPQLQDELTARGCPLPIVFISGHGDIPMAVRAMKDGAVDFIEKPFRDQVLLDCIQEALRKDAEARSQQAKAHDIKARLASLTAKEREVLDLVVEGKANKEIAAFLGVTSKAIEARRAKVMEKMRAGRIAELVRLVVQAQPT
ncbi:MAG: response regulator transcription factor [Phycisphaerae bacterium]|nr:response regulator transcription factor [Phycisphaerae bacterium]